MSSRTSVAAFDAAETLTYALLQGDSKMAARAAADFDAVVLSDLSIPDADTRREVIEVDPMAAATLGWLPYPDLAERVLPDPSRFLDPDEAEAIAADPGLLRVAVLARTVGKSFAEVRADNPAFQSDYALAARGDAKDVQAVYDELVARGVFDRRDG